MLLFCGVRSRVEAAYPGESFKGLPITLVSAAITSLSFMGFGGLVENIINAIFLERGMERMIPIVFAIVVL
ncbi:hypothetical protein NE586_15450, partial [Gemmiger formicilis]|nr:hypothetical protein [Gemmiger formicilis]